MIIFKQITEQEMLEKASQRKQEFQLYDYNELDQLIYPGYITAHLNYFATGEGMTRGIYMVLAMSADDLRKQLSEVWGSYYVLGCEVRKGLAPLPEYENLIPEIVKNLLAKREPGSGPANFVYTSTLHVNYS